MRLFPLILVLLLAAPAAHSATKVDWQDNIFGATLYNSQGILLDDSFTFEFGTFGSSFTPTLANISQWTTQWKLLSRATAPPDIDGHGWNSASQAFGQSFTFNSNGTVQGLAGSATFAAGEQAYLWVSGSNEWALVTDDTPGTSGDDIWLLPAPNAQDPITLTWVLETATHPVFGGANNLHSSAPGSVDPGTFTLQTAVIPEPGSSLLVLLIGVLARLRRTAR